MKLLCSCGHPNHVHFAGTGRCHAFVSFVKCDCQRFVPELEQRADLV